MTVFQMKAKKVLKLLRYKKYSNNMDGYLPLCKTCIPDFDVMVVCDRMLKLIVQDVWLPLLPSSSDLCVDADSPEIYKHIFEKNKNYYDQYSNSSWRNRKRKVNLMCYIDHIVFVKLIKFRFNQHMWPVEYGFNQLVKPVKPTLDSKVWKGCENLILTY